MSTTRDVRAWALRDRGIDLGTHGRLPNALIEAYNAKHPEDPCPINTRGQHSFPSPAQSVESGRRGAASTSGGAA